MENYPVLSGIRDNTVLCNMEGLFNQKYSYINPGKLSRIFLIYMSRLPHIVYVFQHPAPNFVLSLSFRFWTTACFDIFTPTYLLRYVVIVIYLLRFFVLVHCGQ